MDKRKMKSVVGKVVQEMIEREKRKEKILSSDEYILWLIEFTKDYPNFTDEDWLYKPNEISKENKNKVYDLSIFYRIIEDYASRNFILPEQTSFGNIYYIKYNNVGFGIEIADGQGTLFACQRINESYENFIDYLKIQKT